jgi:hypothetical protein
MRRTDPTSTVTASGLHEIGATKKPPWKAVLAERESDRKLFRIRNLRFLIGHQTIEKTIIVRVLAVSCRPASALSR